VPRLQNPEHEAIIQAWVESNFNRQDAIKKIKPQLTCPGQAAYDFFTIPEVKSRCADVYEEWRQQVEDENNAAIANLVKIKAHEEISGKTADLRDVISARGLVRQAAGRGDTNGNNIPGGSNSVKIYIPALVPRDNISTGEGKYTGGQSDGGSGESV
jgi:hypothetical protein